MLTIAKVKQVEVDVPGKTVLRMHQKKVVACINDLQAKKARINSALNELLPLVGKAPKIYGGPERRA